jgi:hypothetical protein
MASMPQATSNPAPSPILTPMGLLVRHGLEGQTQSGDPLTHARSGGTHECVRPNGAMFLDKVPFPFMSGIVIIPLQCESG